MAEGLGSNPHGVKSFQRIASTLSRCVIEEQNHFVLHGNCNSADYSSMLGSNLSFVVGSLRRISFQELLQFSVLEFVDFPGHI